MSGIGTFTTPWIAYVGPVPFPEGGAAVRRILGNAQALAAAGYGVCVVSGQDEEPLGKLREVSSNLFYVSVNERDSEHLPKPLRHLRYVGMGARSRRWLDGQPLPPSAVILYSGYSPYLLRLTSWAKERKIPILFDAVEWYTASHLAEFIASPYLWNIELAMRWLIPRTDGVVAISRALERFYRDRGLPVLRLPPLIDTTVVEPGEVRAEGPLRLVYAGNPARKDLLGVIVEAVLAVDRRQGRVRLDVAGVEEDALWQLPALSGLERTSLPDCIVAHGSLPHARALDLVAAADFSVLLRDINRVSTCGFPTKFVESLAMGTPAIANLTSDLELHLHDGETGLICPTPGCSDLQTVLERALLLSTEALSALRAGARAEAERAFDYRRHADRLGHFLSEMGAGPTG